MPASYWMIAEVIRDAALLSRVRSVIDSCCTNSQIGDLEFDYAKLCTNPLLQSIYAEILRLHVANFIMRGPCQADFGIRGRHIPKDALMLISTYHAQTDPRIWSTKGENSAHSASEFWAQRFLVCPEPSTDCAALSSIKVDDSQNRAKGSKYKRSGKELTSPLFSLKGYSNDWIPYGGGQRMCPGRHFAKQEMISSLAIMLTLFDIELTDQLGRVPENDLVGFGFGTLWPKRETAIKIRRRLH